MDNFKKNNKFLGYLRFLTYTGDLNQIASVYLNPLVLNIETCEVVKRKLRMPAISVENEKAMLKKLENIAQTSLSMYPQTYEEDMELLKNEKLTFNERNCIVYRAGEKKIYLQIIEMVKLGTQLLLMDHINALQYFNSINKDLVYGTYFSKVLIPLLDKK